MLVRSIIRNSKYSCILLTYEAKLDFSISLSRLNEELMFLKFSNFIIVNNYDGCVYILDEKRKVIDVFCEKSSNDYFEFSGYVVGLRAFKNKVNVKGEISRIYLFNDTVYKNGRFRKSEKLSIYIDYLKSKLFFLKRPDLSGFYHAPQELKKRLPDLVPYFNSKFFIIESASVDCFVSNVEDSYRRVFLNEKMEYESSFGYEYDEFLKLWLHGKDSNGWYRASALTNENRLAFELKASCISMEHSLSLTIKKRKELVLSDLSINKKLVDFFFKIKNIVASK